jgi:hypothetical protein
MTSSIAATTVSGALLRISVSLWGVVANTDNPIWMRSNGV